MPREDRVVEPKVLTERSVLPVEEAMVKGLTAPAPTKVKVFCGVVVLMPTLVPVSKTRELTVVDAPLALGR